jgi:hypothetical protein
VDRSQQSCGYLLELGATPGHADACVVSRPQTTACCKWSEYMNRQPDGHDGPANVRALDAW